MYKKAIWAIVMLYLVFGNACAESASSEAIVALGQTPQEVTERIGPPDVVVFSGESDSGKNKEVWLYEKFIDDPVRRLDATRWAFAVDYDWDASGPVSDPFFDPGEKILQQEDLTSGAPAPLDQGYLFTFIDEKLVHVKKQM